MIITCDINTSRGFVEQCAKLATNGRHPRRADEIAISEFILRHGRVFEWKPFPAQLTRGAPRQCYLNATLLAFRSAGYIYVEGYAVAPNLGMPVEHAWCITALRGVVVDPTWESGSDYFGVPFRTEYLRRVVRTRRSYGVLYNPEMKFPLLRGEDRPEDVIAEVPGRERAADQAGEGSDLGTAESAPPVLRQHGAECGKPEARTRGHSSGAPANRASTERGV